MHRRFFILPPPLRPLYHWISATNQPQQHKTYKSKSFRDVLSLFLSLSVSLPNRKMSVSGPTIDFGEPKKKFPGKTIKTTTRSRDPRGAFFRGTSVGVGRERRPTRATSAVRWWIPEPVLIFPASGMYLLHAYLPTYLPTYRCLEFVPFGIL